MVDVVWVVLTVAPRAAVGPHHDLPSEMFFAQRPTYGASNLVNFKFRPYFVTFFHVLHDYFVVYTNFWVCFLNAIDVYIARKVFECVIFLHLIVH